MGGKVNASCGLHVHVGYDKRNTPAVHKLLNLVANHEQALYAVTGTRTREHGVGSRHGTCWCKSIKQYGNAGEAQLHASHDRYHLLNLATPKPTVEFRVFGASLNTLKAIAYVRLCVALCEKSLTAKRTRFASRSTCWTSSRGRGTAELTRLFYDLKWWNTPGIVGVVECEGVPSLKASKKMLRAMAKRYDESPTA